MKTELFLVKNITPDYYGPGNPMISYYMGDHRYTGEARWTCDIHSSMPVEKMPENVKDCELIPCPNIKFNLRGVF
jgi:hypothetical protein